MDETTQESPEYIKLSLAAAMQLNYSPARFYRAARMTCINLLVHYASGCAANCSYCGLAREREMDSGARSFIRVPWPVKPLNDVLDRIAASRVVQRVCLSMTTNSRSRRDVVPLARRIAERGRRAVSILIAPTLMDRPALEALREAGVDRVGVAFDLPTEELFDTHRGQGARGPHRWENYWRVFADAVEVFGKRMVGSHFIVGLGETEREMAGAMQRVVDGGGVNHLFSFFPEAGSALARRDLPPMDVYRRMQIAAELLDSGRSRAERMTFDPETGRLLDFGVTAEELDALIDSGRPFRTRGCEGPDGEVACNRPYANSLPGENIRNYPFAPDADDIRRIRAQMNPEPAQGDTAQVPAGGRRAARS